MATADKLRQDLLVLVRKSNGNLAANGTLYWYMTPGVVAESDLAGTLKSEYVFFDGERVARRDGATGAGGVFYYFSDHLKTASVITDSAGVIKAESDYYPWGGELQFVNNDSNDYKFTGKKRDLETGLDYFGARYYSNGLGRWVSADWSAAPVPVPYADFGDPQTLNLYQFVGGNPASKADPDGHLPRLTIPIPPKVIDWVKSRFTAENLKYAVDVKDMANDVANFFEEAQRGFNQHCGCGPPPAQNWPEDNKNNNSSKSQNTNGEKSGSGKGRMEPKKGESGGPGAGKRINDSTKREALKENQDANGGQAKCVYCKEDVGPGTKNKINYDHAEAKSKGGNNTLNNTQVACE